MSRPSANNWYQPNVVRVIRMYPNLMRRKEALQGQSITANYNKMPGGGCVSRSTEKSALRQLSRREEEIIDAVQIAIEDIGRQRDGGDVLQLVAMVDWQRTHTLEGAAMRLHMGSMTAKRRRNRFISAVAKNLGW